MADIPATPDLSGAAVLPADSAPPVKAADYPPLGQAYWALFIFALSLVVNFTDRGIINLLVTPIKRDLHLSDIEMSLLMGFAFVAFYVILGLPIARLVDSKSRRAIVGFGLACWSMMTALCGIAQNFWSLFLCRVGVGVGEACTGPATFSMLADFFPPHRLTRAIALMSFGAIVGVGLSQMIGAGVLQVLSGVPDMHVPVLGVVHSWQLVFFIVGLPGLVVAALMLTVREPPRRGRMTKTADPSKAVPFSAVLKFVWNNRRCYGPTFIAIAVGTIALSGAGAWTIAFYQRTYGWSPVQAGYLTGLNFLLSGPLGLFLGTWLAERYAQLGFEDANIRLARWSSLIAIPFGIIGPLMPTPWLALGMSFLSLVTGGIAGAPVSAALQLITPNEMRGQISALYLFIVNVLGTGLGPTLTAVLTDVLFGNENDLRYSLALTAAISSPIAAGCYWLCLKHYRAAVARSKAWR